VSICTSYAKPEQAEYNYTRVKVNVILGINIVYIPTLATFSSRIKRTQIKSKLYSNNRKTSKVKNK
jgi:hypothetical protein